MQASQIWSKLWTYEGDDDCSFVSRLPVRPGNATYLSRESAAQLSDQKMRWRCWTDSAGGSEIRPYRGLRTRRGGSQVPGPRHKPKAFVSDAG
jgi:hypothetical protein